MTQEFLPIPGRRKEKAMTDKEEQGPRDFSLFLLDRPATHRELSEKLLQLTTAVQDTGKVGSLQITFKLGLFDGDPDRVVVDDKIVLKVPEHDRKSSIFFPDRDGNLSRTDPNQLAPDMFKDVDMATGEMKDGK